MVAPSRPLKLLIRHFGYGNPLGNERDMGWHWALAVGKENACYEVCGWMVVRGPKGVIAASSPVGGSKRTHLSQFDACLAMPQTTTKSDAEIENFTRQWVKGHPMYLLAGPNCQTYAEDLFTFCCGENLPFAKSATRLGSWGKGDGPERHPNIEWLTTR